MRRPLTAVSLLAASLLAACTSTSEGSAPSTSTAQSASTASSVSTAPAGTSAAPATRATSARGFLVKQLGERAGLGDSAPTAQAWFTLDAVEVDGKCTGGAPSENGHMITLLFSVETTDKLDPEQRWLIQPQDFAVVGPDGVTDTNVSTGAGYGCLSDRDKLPGDPYAPNSKYVGRITLDSRYGQGAITYKPSVTRAGVGWEWAIPTR